MSDADYEWMIEGPRCPSCNNKMVLVNLQITLTNVMVPAHDENGKIILGHQGFQVMVRSGSRCPQCMSEFLKTHSIDQDDRAGVMATAARVIIS
jgi:uncharacterized protein with PIN domain